MDDVAREPVRERAEDRVFRTAGGEVGAALADVDWAATPLGPVEGWPQSLLSSVDIVLRSRFSMWMAWGPELTFLCNDAYRRDTLGTKFPWALGRPTREVWQEIWPDIGPRIATVMAAGTATWDDGLLLFLERSGYPEETYHTFSYSPLTDEAGALAGLLCVVSEDTDGVIGRRRLATLRDLGAARSTRLTEEVVLVEAAESLSSNRRDLPFALLYTLDPAGGHARLRAASGIEAGHPAAPPLVSTDDPAAPWPLGPVADGADGAVVCDLAARFDELPSGAWDEPPTQALVLPLRQQGQEAPAGFLVAALNRYRALDEEYRGFLDLVAGQIAAGLAAARAYEAERDRAEQLAELDKAKTAFFTNVSHELRTPLTLLVGPAADALEDTAAPLPAVHRRRLELVARNADRLARLVNTLLDFSRMESGRLNARFEPVDLAAYTAELAGSFQSATARVGLRLDIDCPPLSGPVRVDADLWDKIVFNLLSNAVKFTFDGAITVRLRDVGDSVELVVEDTGIGIPEEDQPRLFERFYRAAASQARTHEGSGIGLALVAELAELHGGTVSVASVVGKGSTFRVVVPRDGARSGVGPSGPVGEVARTGEADERAAGYLAEVDRWLLDDPDEPRPGTPGGSRARVLVVDDNTDMRAYIARLLGDDYEVESAPDGRVGLELARRSRPDLILTDVMMPVLDGFGLLAELRADPATEAIPVVMLSARAGEEAAVEGLEAGADDYLVKPFSARELRARVRANVELDRARRVRARLERSQALVDQAQRLARLGSWELSLVDGSVFASAETLRQLGLDPSAAGPDGRLGTAAELDSVLLANVHPDDAPRVWALWERARSLGEPFDYEIRRSGPDGPERLYRTLGEVERDGSGRPVRLFGSTQDITEQRATEMALAEVAAGREAAAREHRIADELQRSLVPAPSFEPDDLEVATYYRAGVEGTQVGGDWYDVIDLGAGRTGLVIGDVMGRGVRAAAVMGQLRAAVRAYARLDLSPADVLGLLDGAVLELGSDQIVTCIYAVYDPYDRLLSFANAGHLPPLLRLPGERPERLVGAEGPPLGTGAPMTAPSREVHLPPGSLLTFYTDGLVERRGSDIDAGIDELASVLAEAQDPVATLPDRLVGRLLPDGPDDDVAVLVVGARPSDPEGRGALLEVDGELPAVRVARRFVADHLGEWGVDADRVDDAVLMCSELVANAVVHGKPPVVLRLRSTASGVVMEVSDRATYLPRRVQASLDDEHGRGLQIVAHLSRQWGARPTRDGKAVWCVL